METALLIAVQYALGFVPGVELVTVLLLGFCYVYGAGCGMLTAVAFSLLRCLVWGFVPNVVVLYLVYYTLFALAFGTLGRVRARAWIAPVLLALTAGGCAAAAIVGVPVGALYARRLTALLWTLFAILAAILLFSVVLLALGRGERGKELASVTAFAVLFTVGFSLLDDVLTPLMLGYTAEAAEAYFYGSFLAMIPQTVCTAVSVFVLFLPLCEVFARTVGRREMGQKSPRKR